MSKKAVRLTAAALLAAVVTITSYAYKDRITDMFSYSLAALSYYGSTGDEVINIQSKLRSWGYYDGPVDGDYGYKTFQAVKSFQAKNGLRVDGVAGSETLAALGLPTGARTEAYETSAGAGKDENLLAHIIYGEARGEPYEGQVAVASTIINRTRDGRFPKTIAGVIYQPGAFDAVADGQINLDPDNTAYRAARDALNGWDPTYGCIYYWNPATATSRWIWSRTIVARIGRHVFAK